MNNAHSALTPQRCGARHPRSCGHAIARGLCCLTCVWGCSLHQQVYSESCAGGGSSAPCEVPVRSLCRKKQH
eukprot:9477276-Pyramimonas_sp.AAC.1